ncbi:uncharacterized protein N0V89_005119 [Didymosphaeria variabile]|uniref:SUZ domain-containing protein n=1 Tax=Didymosphaeria variabile TaxID=1932322 RepID=A0A9W9CAZ4_9PLEO|nr:uncharacterized protein N0V89_005119 [Didymosphaeria variabile]KAJ4353390.1 hypothetical protein N0V89_005119 [Didymosphaeria variabile]
MANNTQKQVDAEQKNEPVPKVKLSQKERRAQHAEQQRMLWDSAENPEPMLFLDAQNKAPVQSTFKPAVTLLARKPKAPAGIAGLSLDGDESEEERRKKSEAEFEERKARAQKERAEKERRYAEAREKLFGTPANSDESRGASPRRAGKGRGRGGRDSQPRSSNEQSPARPSASRQLFEPAYSPKPGSVFVQKKDASTSRPSTPNNQEKPIREPRGPQATIRGGRGFAPRGDRNGTVS